MHVCDDSESSLWLNRAVHSLVHGIVVYDQKNVDRKCEVQNC